MFRRYFMPSAHNTALEQGERRFDGVCVHIAVRVFPRVINRLVLALLHVVERPRIDCGLVGQNDFHVAADVGVDNLPHGCRFGVSCSNHAEIAVTLPDADNHGLFTLGTPPPRFAAYICLINFHCTVHLLWRYFQHGRTDAVAEVPCGLVADSEHPFDLIGRDAFLGLANYESDIEPNRERQVGVMQHGSRRYGELVTAIIAIKRAALIDARNLWRIALRAGDLFRPTQLL